MDKTAIKNFAVRARIKLIEDIRQKAYELGISEGEIKDIEVFEGGFRVKALENGKIYKKYEIDQRDKLLSKIKEKGLEQVIEEVAYTWFNRFIALRFMEVNEYLPTGVRVLSSMNAGKSEPDIIGQALELDLYADEKDETKYKEIVYKLMDSGDTEDLYKYLLVKQCNQLGTIMPMVFEEILDYTELLLPDRLLQEGSVVMDLVDSIEEEDYKEQVEIIGWMYQYYISEKKDQVFAGLKKNQKITKENIPAATQLFTPKWIVKYMVENSLGRLWLESHPDPELKAEWKYYLEEAEQDPEVQKKLDELKDPNLNPEDIKILDPAMGSGHILVYAFDVLYDVYLKANYSERDIPRLILEKNLYGLDIDDRAGQLSAFALMMKARSVSRRVFRNKIELNVCSIQESNILIQGEKLDSQGPLCQYFLGDTTGQEREILQNDFIYIVDVFYDAKEYGSILDVEKVDFDGVAKRLEEIRVEHTEMFNQGYKNVVLEELPMLLKQARIMSSKYDVVVGNPPYMGHKGMNNKLSSYVKKEYPDSKTDFFSIFMERSKEYSKLKGFYGMITQPSWLFLSTFTKLREKLIDNNCIYSLLHMGRGIFGIDFGSTAFVIRNICESEYTGNYFRLHQRIFQYIDCDDIKKLYLETTKNNDFEYDFSQYKTDTQGSEGLLEEDTFKSKNQKILYRNKQMNFKVIPNWPISYWVSDKFLKTYKNNIELGDIASPRTGMTTADNNRFLRLWFEVLSNKVGYDCKNKEEAKKCKCKWYPYSKGGGFRRWKGFDEYVVNWDNDGFEIKNNKNKSGKKVASVRSEDKYFQPCITWSAVTSYKFSSRIVDYGRIFDSGGSSVFLEKNIYYIQALLNTKLAQMYLDISNTTLNYQPKDICKIPIIFPKNKNTKNDIEFLTQQNCKISTIDWDSSETSWDFKQHPLINSPHTTNGLENNILDQGQNLAPCHFEQSEESFPRPKLIEEAFANWTDFTNQQFDQLKANEEELNRIFIDIYGLQDELTPDVEDKDITISKADRETDIKSLISYAVGCIFGRYSLDQEGLIYAGGDFKVPENSSIDVTMDNILIIADDDYFEDDITNRFINFVKIAYGAGTLEENLDYIAETLNKKAKETSRQAIRRYFLKDLYKDHVKIYKKRPIYWQFDSGKQDGFKALIYMHRYDSSTVARVRTDYLHEIQKKYQAEIKHIDIVLESDLSPREQAAALKKKAKTNKQIAECILYDQVIAHVANQEIEFDLDDGVKVNYEKFQKVSVSQGDGSKDIKADLLAKI